MQSIMSRLITLDGRTDVLPGHGRPSTIADEGMKNPFLQPFNEPDTDHLDWDADGIELHGGEA